MVTRIVQAALAALLLAACSSSAHYPAPAPVPQLSSRRLSNLYELGARDLRCPMGSLASARIGDRVWQVSGCGASREYALYQHGPTARWQRIAPLGARASNELGCPADEIAVRLAEDGIADAAGCGRAASYQLQCGSRSCDWVVVERSVRFAPSGAYGGEPRSQAPPSGTVIVVPDERSPVDPAVDAAIRAALDAQRDALAACGAAGLPIRARWGSDGMVRLSLDPPYAGSDRDACVRSSLPTYGVRTATPGEIVHVVR